MPTTKYPVGATVTLKNDLIGRQGAVLVIAGTIGVIKKVLDPVPAYWILFTGDKINRLVQDADLV